MNKIGYRVKLNDYLSTINNLSSFLTEYFNLFDVCEVKINRKLLSSNYSYEAINELFSRYQNRFSFHFNKNLINEEVSLNSIEKYILSESKKYPCKIKCITHFHEEMDEEYLKKIIFYKSLFNGNSSLVLENPSINGDIKSYLMCISEILHKLSEYKIDSGICLDLGHLFFYNRDYDSIISIIEKENLLQFIKEYHLHNVIGENDHQSLFKGEIDYKYLISNLVSKSAADIIMECEVIDMKDDGLENIKNIKRYLKK